MTDELPADRSCEDAGIPDAFCSCYDKVEFDPKAEAAVHAATSFVEKLNAALTNVSDICAAFELEQVAKVTKIKDRDKYMVQVKTKPAGEFEGWVEFKHRPTAPPPTSSGGQDDSGGGGGGGGQKERKKTDDHDHSTIVKVNVGEISRLDSYGETSACVNQRDDNLRELCYCKHQPTTKSTS